MASIATQIGERSENLAKRESRGVFLKFAYLVLKYGSAYQARAHLDAERVTPRVREIVQKAAIPPATLSDWAAISDYQNISEAFQESLRSLSVFDAVLADGMVKAPLRSRGFSVTTGIIGSAPNELAVKTISSLVLATQLLEPKKASAIVIVTKELLSVAGSQQLFANELTKAVTAATDTAFIASLISSTTPSASAGATLANITTDFDTLLAAVTTSATSRLYYVASPTNIKGLVAKANAGGTPAFPELTITGGPLFGGITAIASDSISSAAALLFDATAIVGNADLIGPGRSRSGTPQMGTAPDSPPTSATALLSLWQNDLIALRMERFFVFTLMRSSGAASLSGVSY